MQSRKKHGRNSLDYKKENSFLDALKGIVKEPMVILLAVASSIYFISGNIGDGIFLASAIVLVGSISLYQDSRSRKALATLKDLTQPHSRVIRNAEITEIHSDEIVIGDCLMVEEGNIIPADGTIVHSNDFSVNESLLTDESLSVFKDITKSDNRIFTGTTVASEPIPFDPMETALHQAYGQLASLDERPNYSMVHEYPLGGKPPMMTHLFENASGHRIISAKGAPEGFLEISGLVDAQKIRIGETIEMLGKDGYRLLGVGRTDFEGIDYPKNPQDFQFEFLGIVAFYDPPKENIREVLQEFDKAGTNVKLVTGDNSTTATAIARQVEFIGYEKRMSGQELMPLSEAELREKVKTTQVFTRMFPDAKLRIIDALKANHEVVAMIGDGVNDGPALGWMYPTIFSPSHVILLEPIMGPTCSIIYENEPMEKNSMIQKPRPFTATFFNFRELATSIVQGAGHHPGRPIGLPACRGARFQRIRYPDHGLYGIDLCQYFPDPGQPLFLLFDMDDLEI